MYALKTPLAAFLLAAGLGACATMIDTNPEARGIASQSVPDTPIDWQAVGAKVGDVQVGWAARFNDPVLMRLIDEAQSNNRNIQAAAANVDRSWALAKQAGAALTPSLGLSAGAGGSGNGDGFSQGDINVGAQASWELDVWGRIRSGQQATVSSAEAAEADYRYARQSLAAGVARAYFISIEAAAQQQISEEVLATLTEVNRVVQVQYDNGVASQQDVSLARADLASSADSLEATRGSKRDALRALELLLGRYPGADIDVGLSLPANPSQPPAGLPAEILERRPDIVAAERRIAGSIAGVNQAKAARLPSISLTGSVGGASDDLSSLLNPMNLAWQAASSLLVPVIDGGARDAAVDIATADQEAAVAAYADAALTAFGEVETALDQSQVLARRKAALEVAEREAENALRIANLRYSEGETDLTSVLAIQQRVEGSKSSLLSIQRLQLDQVLDLNMALGGDWQDPDQP
ncbi:MAG: efflux transporter outer membrane subunit [Henriciella sp.]|jgi:NodT family efflux transporter outer membrane factor (OMF) lipoprotein